MTIKQFLLEGGPGFALYILGLVLLAIGVSYTDEPLGVLGWFLAMLFYIWREYTYHHMARINLEDKKVTIKVFLALNKLTTYIKKIKETDNHVPEEEQEKMFKLIEDYDNTVQVMEVGAKAVGVKLPSAL